jgi:hypothetical protein
MTQAKVYSAIAAVTADLAKEGIGKTHSNVQQKYRFRGIDDVYNTLAPLLAKHKLNILPRFQSREVVERRSASGNALFYVTVAAEFDFVSAEDGSSHTVRMFGEAMDSGDKATNKAMSAAYKYAAFQAFCIPTEGDNDADATTHEVAVSGTIDDAQWGRLVSKLEAKQADAQKFCAYMKVRNLKEIRAADFSRAMEALDAKADPKPVKEKEAA